MKCHELLNDASKWTQNAAARNCDGDRLLITADTAASWDIVGAIFYCYIVGTHEQVVKIANELQFNPDKGVYMPLRMWNDVTGRTYDEVITLLRKLDI
jgi:hypothetical protein